MKISRFAFFVATSVSLVAGILIGCSPVVRADQPHMQAALNTLLSAEHELAVAEADKGGPRVAALRATSEAIGETKAGIEFARGR